MKMIIKKIYMRNLLQYEDDITSKLRDLDNSIIRYMTISLVQNITYRAIMSPSFHYRKY